MQKIVDVAASLMPAIASSAASMATRYEMIASLPRGCPLESVARCKKRWPFQSPIITLVVSAASLAASRSG